MDTYCHYYLPILTDYQHTIHSFHSNNNLRLVAMATNHEISPSVCVYFLALGCHNDNQLDLPVAMATRIQSGGEP